MIYGAYFLPRSLWPDAVQLGIRCCVRPVVTPDPGNGVGFVTKDEVVDITDGRVAWRYLCDEADLTNTAPHMVTYQHVRHAEKHTRTRTVEIQGGEFQVQIKTRPRYFFTVTGRHYGRAAWQYRHVWTDLCGCVYYPLYRADSKGALPYGHLYGMQRLAIGLATAASVGVAWLGRPWTGVAQSIQGGLLDADSCRPMSHWLAVEQALVWRLAGARYCFFWRADVPDGWDCIRRAMRILAPQWARRPRQTTLAS